MSRMVTSSLALLSVIAACCCDRPRYIRCQTSEECGRDSCCVIGFGRYTVPNCYKRLDKGEACRMQDEPANTTLHYPDGTSVELTGVHYVSCPCLPGLRCSQAGDLGPRCEHELLYNSLLDYNWEDFDY